MAAPVSACTRFASVCRKVGTCVFTSAFIGRAATCGCKMDSERAAKVRTVSASCFRRVFLLSHVMFAAVMTLEFAVQMTCESCADKVRAALQDQPGVTSVRIDVAKEEVLVESTLTTADVQALIESTGRRAVLKGIGGSEQDRGSAVAMMAGVGNVQGVVRFLQLSEGHCLIDGTIDGLEPGPHGLHVHTLGDLTQDCLSCGEHYNPFGRRHGGPGDSERHAGDLGNIVAGPDGRASFRLEDSQIKVWDVIGRSLVVDAGEDDLGRGGHPLSEQTGNSGERLACGIIARSAGLFQNPKQICACDGVTLWEERERPIAGRGRSKADAQTPAANL
ncbi:Copper chaperone for superoxide dismutase [Nibea albiflora]|uniref:Copper chaperone for superoxide dismutase n=1 Tax=Nibea albiflora TaxID=240163 RepID=A0ACB7EW40_NIBAL|nr:Copper chaperone for superoxide dismutase [Nibea albiflora]